MGNAVVGGNNHYDNKFVDPTATLDNRVVAGGAGIITNISAEEIAALYSNVLATRTIMNTKRSGGAIGGAAGNAITAKKGNNNNNNDKSSSFY